MKVLSILTTALLLYVTRATAESDTPAQPAWYETIDISSVLNNKRLWLPYMKCVLEQGKCSVEGKELKSAFKEALGNHCKSCTGEQQVTIHRIVAHLIDNEPEIWQALVEKYDPKKEYLGFLVEEAKGAPK